MPEGGSRVQEDAGGEARLTLHIDVVFDTICPWCFIGKRRLDAALRLRPLLEITRRWHPFMLNPDMPSGGIDRQAYLFGKFGNESRIARIYGAIAEAGLVESIPFAFERIRKTPNSIDSHRLVQFADGAGLAEPVIEALFLAYFVEGRDIGEREVLLDIGIAQGLDAGSLQRYLDSQTDASRIRAENATYHRLGINGVPAFIFNRKFVVTGAQEPAILARAVDAAAAVRAPAA